MTETSAGEAKGIMNRVKISRGAISALTVGSLIFVGAACGKAEDKLAEKIVEKGIESGTGGDVDINTEDGSVKIKTDDGEATYGGSEIPEGWPDDVPIIDHTEVLTTSSMSSDEGENLMVMVITEKSVADTVAWYKDRLTGWTKDSESSMSSDGDELIIVSFSKDGRSVSMTVLKDADGTNVSITYKTAGDAGA